MGIIGGTLGYRLLRQVAPHAASAPPPPLDAAADRPDLRLRQHFGDGFFELVRDKQVIDFGCGLGAETVEMARRGAATVVGLDIQDRLLERARLLAQQQGVADRCTFANTTDEPADIIVSKDAFEHFADPGAILRGMGSLLKPGGFILASFGPTWLHPYGGHLFSVFPWAHLVFTERALIRWRADFKSDGARRFGEVEGGLNQITIKRFERIVEDNAFCVEWLDTVPIRGIGLFKHRALREWGSSIVRCRLTPTERFESRARG